MFYGDRVGFAQTQLCTNSRKFVNDFFKQLKAGAEESVDYSGQYKRRKTGVRKMRGVESVDEANVSGSKDLYTMRDLRKDVYG